MYKNKRLKTRQEERNALIEEKRKKCMIRIIFSVGNTALDFVMTIIIKLK